MTADAMFDRVLALMFSDDTEKSDLLTQFLATLNIHLLELMPQENAIRQSEGGEQMGQPPLITGLSDTVDYSGRILAFLPYGVAGTMLAEDEPNIATQYKNKYEEERAACVVARFTDVVDAYAI